MREVFGKDTNDGCEIFSRHNISVNYQYKPFTERRSAYRGANTPTIRHEARWHQLYDLRNENDL